MHVSVNRRPLFSRVRLVALAAAAAVVGLIGSMAGCKLVGGMLDSYERTQEVEIAAQYRGLDHKSTVVLIDAPMDIQYEYPRAILVLTEQITLSIARTSPGARVVPTRAVLAFQENNIHWPTMEYSEIAGEFGVDRVVLIDLNQYRLFGRGNSYIWDGNITADVFVVEADGIDPTSFAFSKHMDVSFPTVEGVTRDQASAADIERGLQITFSRKVGRLFHNYTVTNDELRKEERRR